MLAPDLGMNILSFVIHMVNTFKGMDRTHTRHGASPKRLFLYPLRADAREALQGDGGR